MAKMSEAECECEGNVKVRAMVRVKKVSVDGPSAASPVDEGGA